MLHNRLGDAQSLKKTVESVCVQRVTLDACHYAKVSFCHWPGDALHPFVVHTYQRNL